MLSLFRIQFQRFRIVLVEISQIMVAIKQWCNNFFFTVLQTKQMSIFFSSLLSRQILVPRTSRGRPTPMSPGRPLKILFGHPGDVPIWRFGDVLIWRPGEVLKWHPGDVLIWRSRDVPGRFIWDVPRTFSGRCLEDPHSTQTWMS